MPFTKVRDNNEDCGEGAYCRIYETIITPTRLTNIFILYIINNLFIYRHIITKINSTIFVILCVLN